MLRKILGILLCIVICLIAPIIVEDIIVNGIFGYAIDTYLGKEEWFSFYGSYLGAIITIGIFFITLRNEKKQIINEIRAQKTKEKFTAERETAKEIVSLMALDKFYSDPCSEISFSAVNIIKNDIRRVKLLRELVKDNAFLNKVDACINYYEKVIANEIDETCIVVTVVRPAIDKLKEYYLKCGIDEEYLDFLKRIEDRELQELLGK